MSRSLVRPPRVLPTSAAMQNLLLLVFLLLLVRVGQSQARDWEDQDFWRLSGIYRDVFLFSTPRVHVRDFFALPVLDDEYRNAVLDVEIDLVHYARPVGSIPGPHAIALELVDPAGNTVSELAWEALPFLPGTTAREGGIKLVVNGPKLWTCETPYCRAPSTTSATTGRRTSTA